MNQELMNFFSPQVPAAQVFDQICVFHREPR